MAAYSEVLRILSDSLAKSDTTQASILLVGGCPGEEVLVHSLPGSESRYRDALEQLLRDIYSEGAPAVGSERGIVQLLLPGARGRKLAIIPIGSGETRIGTLNVSLPEGEPDESLALKFWTQEAERIGDQLIDEGRPSELPRGGDSRLPEGAEDMGLREIRERALEAIEGEYLRKILRSTKGNISKAARRAGITRRTLYNKIYIYGIDHREHRKAQK